MGDPTPDTISLKATPLGRHPRWGYAWRFPPTQLPLVAGGRRSFGCPDLEPNRLFLGDNLQVMRSLPDASIDLITIDPPFFSGRNYEPGSGEPGPGFSDVWEGGLAEYLIWLNARLYEMKRLLKPTGTFYIHLDYHAAHYVKVELDKLFGYGRMLNEIVWHMNSGQRRAHAFGPRHNLLLRYSLSDTPTFNADAVREPYSPDINVPASKAHYYHPDGKVADDVWRIPIIPQNDRHERVGYPTQKPEALLERIILASSNPGDTVADFFCGSGTALVVAQRLGRRWIGCDLAPEAIEITLRRLSRLQQTVKPDVPDVALFYTGLYPMPEAQAPATARAAIVAAWGGQVWDEGPVHGVKGREAVHVAAMERGQAVTEADIKAFAQALKACGWRQATLLARAFEPGARRAAERLALAALTPGPISSPIRRGGGVHLKLVGLEFMPGPGGPFLAFILPPRVRLRLRRSAELLYRFSAADSVALNPGARVDRVEWEIEAAEGGAADGEITPEDRVGWRARCRLARPGRYRVLCRVHDDRGGEGFAWRMLSVN